jgi:predicted transposase YdaD
MIFVDYVRENHKENDYENLQDAIERAIDRCIEENVLRGFFMEHRSEVVKVMQLDYTFDRQIMLEREEGRTEGRKEGWDKGLEEGREEGIREEKERSIQTTIVLLQELMHPKEICLGQLQEKYGLKEEEAEDYMRKYWKPE